MEAGRELDALIAEKVMRYVRVTCDDYVCADGNCVADLAPTVPIGWRIDPTARLWKYSLNEVPHFSTDMAAAWQVVERMLDTTFKGKLDHIWSLTAREAAEAICQAALEEGGIYARSTTDRMVLEDAGT